MCVDDDVARPDVGRHHAAEHGTSDHRTCCTADLDAAADVADGVDDVVRRWRRAGRRRRLHDRGCGVDDDELFHLDVDVVDSTELVDYDDHHIGLLA
jgi:hypothetical protein